jgi:TonB family protein
MSNMIEATPPSKPPSPQQKAGMSSVQGILVVLLLVFIPIVLFLVSVYIILPSLESSGYKFFWEEKSDEGLTKEGNAENTAGLSPAINSDNDRKTVGSEETLLPGNKPKTKSGVKPTTPTIDSGEGSGDSNRSMTDILEAVVRHNGELSQIYNQFLKHDPDLQGTVVVSFTINSSGQVINAYVVSSTLGNPDMEQRILSAVYGWYFPAYPEGETQVTYPFVFSPSK